MGTLRKKKSHQKYLKLIAKGFLTDGCNLCNKKKTKSLKEFRYWRIINNLFPYDRIAKINHIILPKRHTAEKKLTKAEKKEFEIIKSRYIEQKYEFLIETVNKQKSIPGHFHIHLIIIKD
ncbi:MAG: hypothetical protein UU82_C0011G0009 [Candidatus Nomurabacteria bacterium GW2011_GWC2_41_8]|uniref:HIT domain-containing protein n=3 Tax=Candidatus Nomuraibacteriota TaxID=1752729 RepID=A0A1F6YBY8_9BACT|nr:MAG: hypothetical protein UU58_C0008G0017 [Candidatus Nomurabacteria bacterium GW2011_GWA2_41_25]KKS24113.1 MAG: hypothetical protein UU82_C0011G0009 [Candidatus Nomurabacteria bacterium GW2011_GWC2_41_8]OGI66712.1 MAG: hypothetical protein A2823_00745 [Candidatus Nomurabacteria bacterium RIFCSPHIGHO2_01_FULL_41_91]OGI80366.1 MAG: hypothetical protein A3D43_02180 [Candidatus Nomurabacteria bacterium RIFCSPHIGHO2_02_FULL_41_52]OGI85335.1 MAG: hypothetical protein A3F49_01400 [Candidatus Nomur